MANPRPVRWFDAERFVALRKAQQLSQADVAEELNVAQATVSRWERGRRQPTARQGDLLADLVGVDSLYVRGALRLEL